MHFPEADQISPSDWHAASRLPLKRFDREALSAYLTIAGDPTPVIRGGLAAVPSPVWATCADGLASLFRSTQPSHCFHSQPHGWARFHEPQITAGFAHFLTLGDRRRRVARAKAFVAAAWACGGRDPTTITSRAVDGTRCVAEENRTDILVELRSGSTLIGASIEAKFGHHLTTGQLPKALRHARDACGWNLHEATLLIVAPDADALDGPILRRNRQFGWRATSWWSLLSHIESFTDPDHDCDDYRRFRRTVWRRAY